MRHEWFMSWFLVVGLVSCQHAPAEPVPVPPGELVGNWTRILTDTAGCAGSTSILDSITLHVVLAAPIGPDDGFQFVEKTVSTWSAGTVSGWLDGFFPADFGSGAVLNLSTGSYAVGVSPQSTAQFIGPLDSHVTLRGVVADPLSAGQTPFIGSQPCTYRARAYHL